MASLSFLEKVGNTSPNSAGFSLKGGRALGVYLLEDASATDLQNAIIQILGQTSVAPGDGRVQQTPPAAHPIYPWLMADSITNIVGIGPTGENEDTPDEDLEVETLVDEYADYNYWQITVEFKSLPYPVATNDSIPINDGSYYDSDGNSQTYEYPDEWSRYTECYYLPKDDNNLSSKSGQMEFKTGSGGPPHTLPVTIMPTMFLPDVYVRVIWHSIPYRYVTSTNSYITKMRGTINQNDLSIAGVDFPAGCLLYLSYTAEVYTPPVQQAATFFDGIATVDKLCDVTFTFLRTDRAITNAPTPPTNQNYIMAGHNLLPFLTDRAYYYCASVPSSGEGTPAWLSAPHELMQQDADA